MRWITTGLAVAIFAIVVAVQADAANRPALRIVGSERVVVQGAAFLPSERVVVTALAGLGPGHVVVRAGRRGTFGAQLGTGVRPCGMPLAVRAVGSNGSRVTLHLPARPCPQSPSRTRPRIEVPPPMR
jgi:hypothetical protein